MTLDPRLLEILVCPNDRGELDHREAVEQVGAEFAAGCCEGLIAAKSGNVTFKPLDFS